MQTQKKYTLAELAAAVEGELVGDGSRLVNRPVHPDDAGADDLVVAMAPAFLAKLPDSRATMALVAANAADNGQVPANITDYIKISRAQRAMSATTGLYDLPRYVSAGIHPSAVIDPSAKLGKDVTVGPFTVIGPETIIGDSVTIHASVTIGGRVSIGSHTTIYTGVRVGDNTQIGNRTIIQPNAVLGSDGFSFVTRDRGSVEQVKSGESQIDTTQSNTHLLRIASLGPVIVGDDVEIGAGTTIDRATLRATRIGNGTKIDNLVQIGHNCRIGRNCLIAGMSGLAGSTVLEDSVMMGARASAAGHLTIGFGSVLAAAASVTKSFPPGSRLAGAPAQDAIAWRREVAGIRRMTKRGEHGH